MAAVLPLILIGVASGWVWPKRFRPGQALLATLVGWAGPVAIYVVGSSATSTKKDDVDPGFWAFNIFLLLVGLGLTVVSSRRVAARAITP